MSNVTNWSPTDEAAENKLAAPHGFPEPMLAGVVNDSARGLMGSVRRMAEDGGWFDWGHDITYVSPTTVTVALTPNPGNPYEVGRRVRAIQSPGGPQQGTILSYNAGTGVLVVDWDPDDSGFTVAVGVPGTTDPRNGVSVGPKPLVTPAPVAEFTAGMIMMHGGNPATDAAPTGWIWCTGSLQNVGADPTVQALWDVIGTRFGGTSQNAFQVPNMGGNVPVGYASTDVLNGVPPDVRVVGRLGGTEDVTLTKAQIPRHTHNYTRPSLVQNAEYSSGFEMEPKIGTAATEDGASSGLNGQSHRNVQPSLVLAYIIKK